MLLKLLLKSIFYAFTVFALLGSLMYGYAKLLDALIARYPSFNPFWLPLIPLFVAVCSTMYTYLQIKGKK